MNSRLYDKYIKEIKPALQKEFSFGSVMMVPKLERISINTGIGKFLKNKQARADIERDITLIAGQRPVKTKAGQSISAFGIREGEVVGMSATLRGERMYDFFDRLISIALPRVRDFRGLPQKGFDGRGNYTFGIPDQEIFPEVSHEDLSTQFGFQITIVTTAKNDKEGLALLSAFGFPFAKDDDAQLPGAVQKDSKADRVAAVKEKYAESAS